jgi:3,4-dihydroxy-2-butanone 4-phosphate synthase
MEGDLSASAFWKNVVMNWVLKLMVNNNTALHETAFTVSVDLLGHGCTTGISAQDRSKTVQALIDPATKPEDLGKPGHIFPLTCKKRWCFEKSRSYRSSSRPGKFSRF